MKLLSLILCFIVIFFSLPKASCEVEARAYISESDILLIEKALQTTAPNAAFSVLVSLASVIINRYVSPIYPDSVLSVIEGTRFISIDHSVTTEDRARLAVKFALAGSSPIKDAAGVFFSESGEVPDVAEYILIDGWYFYSD